MKNRFEEFHALHKQKEVLLIANVWDVQSARIFEASKFKAIATSSSAVAECLGYADGQQMSFEEYLFIIKRIMASVSIPLSVDIEFGYGDTTDQIADNIGRLHDLGVVGINIEDSVIVDGKRSISAPEEFATNLKFITSLLKSRNKEIFIHLRSDPYLLGLADPLGDALTRIKYYDESGAHGLFFPCVTKIEDIKKIAAASTLPVSVMCMPDLPGFKALEAAGIHRISMGPFAKKYVYRQLEETVSQVLKEGSFKAFF